MVDECRALVEGPARSYGHVASSTRPRTSPPWASGPSPAAAPSGSLTDPRRPGPGRPARPAPRRRGPTVLDIVGFDGHRRPGRARPRLAVLPRRRPRLGQPACSSRPPSARARPASVRAPAAGSPVVVDDRRPRRRRPRRAVADLHRSLRDGRRRSCLDELRVSTLAEGAGRRRRTEAKRPRVRRRARGRTGGNRRRRPSRPAGLRLLYIALTRAVQELVGRAPPAAARGTAPISGGAPACGRGGPASRRRRPAPRSPR